MTAYDPVRNRLTVQQDGLPTPYQPNNGQKLLNAMHRYAQVGSHTLNYDVKGNLLSDGTNTYTYDIFNRQITMTGPGGNAEYVYDALGRRVAKIVDNIPTYFVYNASYQVLEERNAANALAARYTYGAGIDEVLTMERGGVRYTYHRDALGSITELTNQSGALVERYEYDVYGAPQFFDSTGNPLTASAIGNPYLFTGRQYDPESGNYDYRARVYSPALGRFLQTDPLGYVDGLNLYVYVGNNPGTHADPMGYSPNDYLDNQDNSITFTGRTGTLWEVTRLFDDLGYATWQDARAQFVQDYPEAAGWWTEDGSWTGQKGASLIGKILHGKNQPTVIPSLTEPPPLWCDPLPPLPPLPPLQEIPPPLLIEPCDPALGWDYYWDRDRRHQSDCWRRLTPPQRNPKIVENIYQMGEVDRMIDDCINNPPRWGLHQDHPECLADPEKCRTEIQRIFDCFEAITSY